MKTQLNQIKMNELVQEKTSLESQWMVQTDLVDP